MRFRRNSNATHKAFAKAVDCYFARAGVTGVPLEWYPKTPEYHVLTLAGIYKCHTQFNIPLLPDHPPLNHIGIMGRFENPAAARDLVDCNPHTGKWNFDGNGYVAGTEAAWRLAEDIVGRITRLIAVPPAALMVGVFKSTHTDMQDRPGHYLCLPGSNSEWCGFKNEAHARAFMATLQPKTNPWQYRLRV